MHGQEYVQEEEEKAHQTDDTIRKKAQRQELHSFKTISFNLLLVFFKYHKCMPPLCLHNGIIIHRIPTSTSLLNIKHIKHKFA